MTSILKLFIVLLLSVLVQEPKMAINDDRISLKINLLGIKDEQSIQSSSLMFLFITDIFLCLDIYQLYFNCKFVRLSHSFIKGYLT